MIYLSMFLLSSFFIYVSEKKKNRIVNTICIIIALSLPILMATFRDISVGIDVEYYVVPFWNRAHNWNSLIKYATLNDIDILYATINFILSRFFVDIKWLFFFIYLIEYILIYKSFVNMKQIGSVWFSMLLYYFLCYNNSLSTVRQSLGMAFVLLGISLLFRDGYKKKSYFKAIICVLIATGIQTGCFVGVIIIVIIFLARKGLNAQKAFLYFLVLVPVLIGLKNKIITLLYSIAGIINTKYIGQSAIRTGGLSDNLMNFLFGGIIFVIISLICLKIKENNFDVTVFNNCCLVTVMGFIGLEIALSDYQPVVRLLQNLQFFWIFSLVQGWKLLKKDIINIRIYQWLITGFVGIYWWYMYIWVDMVSTANYIIAY